MKSSTANAANYPHYMQIRPTSCPALVGLFINPGACQPGAAKAPQSAFSFDTKSTSPSENKGASANSLSHESYFGRSLAFVVCHPPGAQLLGNGPMSGRERMKFRRSEKLQPDI